MASGAAPAGAAAATPPAPGAITAIQVLRAAAALMVVWYHGHEQFDQVAERLPAKFGMAGVDLFFVISGFIMVVTMSPRHGPAEARAFIVRRLIRVVPMYWLCTAALVGLALAAPGWFRSTVIEPVHVIKSLLFVPAMSPAVPGRAWPVLIPGWTLNLEMGFYTLFAAFMLAPRRWRVAPMAGLLLAVAVTGLLVWPTSALAATYTNPVVLNFAVGVWLGDAWSRRAPDAPTPAPWPWVAVCGGAVLLAAPIGLPLRCEPLLGAALLVWGGVRLRRPGAPMGWAVRLGDASYSIYLTHLFALGALRALWKNAFGEPQSLPSVLCFQATCVIWAAGIGWLAFRSIESPLVAWCRRQAVRVGWLPSPQHRTPSPPAKQDE